MVNVTHNDNNGISRLEVCIVVLCSVDNSVFDCDNNLFLYLCAELCCNDFCCIKVEHIVDCSHLTEEEELLDNLGGCHLELEGKIADRDFLGKNNRNLLICTLCLDTLDSLLLCFTAVSTCALLAVLLGLLVELLLTDRRILNTL